MVETIDLTGEPVSKQFIEATRSRGAVTDEEMDEQRGIVANLWLLKQHAEDPAPTGRGHWLVKCDAQMLQVLLGLVKNGLCDVGALPRE